MNIKVQKTARIGYRLNWFLFINFAFLISLTAETTSNKVVCITIPKCGTNLFIKCLSLLDKEWLNYSYNHSLKPSEERLATLRRINRRPPPNHHKGRAYLANLKPFPEAIAKDLKKQSHSIDHFPYTKRAEDFLYHNTKANFFIIRDPRAMLASMAFMLKDGWEEGQHEDPQNLMWDFITGQQKHFIQWGVEINQTYPLLWEKGVIEFYKLYLPWMKARKMLTVRFEDLVGSKGGGSDKIQEATLYAIANHLEIRLTIEKLEHIKKELFGNSRTFREGRIDGWKKYFTAEMKQAFKKIRGANQLLIDLGYEKDSNW